ncbi:hypothetical protein SESBI_44713 [Sesbania bispinosa]|nr:hypothetical protein SESBI_44713 [Sesbania bispinosa]
MESYGLPCDHILSVMMYLDIGEIPRSLILVRWTKSAKEYFLASNRMTNQYWKALLEAMLKSCEDMCEVACLSRFGYYDTMDKIERQKEF